MNRFRATNTSKSIVLLVDSDPLVGPLIVKELSQRFEVVAVPDYQSARKILESYQNLVAVVCDWYLAGPETGLDLLAEVHWALPTTARILASATLTADMAEESLRSGIIHAFVPKPCRPGEILAAVLGTLHTRAPRWPRAESPPQCA